ncbi:MAG: GTP cyclohydrolase I FolE [Candidatus Hydrothermales bacterium]
MINFYQKIFQGMEEKIKNYLREILRYLGENPERDGLLKTPERFLNMLKELTEGYRIDPEDIVKDAIFHANTDQMIIVKDIDFSSLCEHHLIPFFGKINIGFIPDKKIIGLSKIPRIVEIFSKKLQVQERLTEEIASFLYQKIEPKGLGITVEAIHLCTVIRGVKNRSAKLFTSKMMGNFKDFEIKNEFLNEVKG